MLGIGDFAEKVQRETLEKGGGSWLFYDQQPYNAPRGNVYHSPNVYFVAHRLGAVAVPLEAFEGDWFIPVLKHIINGLDEMDYPVLGTWVDYDEGVVWVEGSSIIHERGAAMFRAVQEGQKAVYDLQAGEAIPVEVN